MRAPTSHSVKISDKETLEWSSADSGLQPKSAKDLERLAHWLDSVFEIPGIRLRFGIDALLGLLPGFGDTASAFASVYILQAATKYGVPRVTLARMTLNIGIDLIVGAIPIVGDLFDVYWKANQKNVQLLRRHFKANPMTERSLKRSDGLFVAGMIALILAILLASVTGAYFILSWGFSSLSHLAH
jgi:hypothetical protein